jgi:proline iminopeptidase
MKNYQKMRFTLFIFFLSSIVNSIYAQDVHRESILDRIIHIEDEIHYSIDTVPMLCDELDMKGQLVDIGDCQLYCEVKGDGIPLVLLNGGPGTTHHMHHPWFQHAEQFCKVVYYDQRGCGQSDFIAGDGYSFRQAVDDLEKLRKKLGFEKWVVCGFSYGGGLAQYYMTMYPESVMGTILVGAAPMLQEDKLNQTQQFDFISQEEKIRMGEIGKLYIDNKIDLNTLIYNRFLNGDWKRQFYYKPNKDEIARIALYEWINDKNFNALVGSDYNRRDFKGVFNNNPIPTLICEGRWDLTWSVEKIDIFKSNHPNAKLVIFENSAHTIYNEETELFFVTIKEFIKDLKPTSSDSISNWKQDIAPFLMTQIELEKSQIEVEQ